MKWSKIINGSIALLFMTICITISFILPGCGQKNETNGPTSGDTTKPKEPCDEKKALVALNGDLYTLKLSSTEFYALKATDANTKQLIFQFYFNDDSTNFPTLIVFPAKANNKFIKNSSNFVIRDTLHPDQPSHTLTKVNIFGDQELTFRAVEDFLRDNSIASFTNLIFTPKQNAQNYIYYNITLEGVTRQLNGTLDTNPSPPKDAGN